MFSTNVNMHNVINKKPNPASIGYAISIKDGMACFSLMSGSLASRKPVTTLIVLKPLGRKVICRSMMQASHAARVVYHLFNVITNPKVLNNIEIDRKTLIDGFIEFSLDDKKGVIQHKTALAKHLLTESFSGEELYSSWRNITKIPYVTAVQGQTDLRALNELRVIKPYSENFQQDISSIQANLDSQPGNFHAQKKTNQDFWVTIKTNSTKCLDKFSTVRRTGYIPQDEKSGTGMFASATRGTIGLLSYDNHTNDNIQIMSRTYSLQDLIEHDKKNLNMIEQGLKHDNNYDRFIKIISDAKEILNEKNKVAANIHNEYQSYIWDNIQTNNSYNRSVSFIFITNISYMQQTPEEIAFSTELHKLLGDKLYDLDKRGDCRNVSIAMLKAYQKTVDKKIVEKLNYLHHQNVIAFNKKFIEDFAYYIKTHVNDI